MSTAQQSHQHPFRRLDDSVQRVLGADLRLIYGMAAPMLMIIGLILLLALRPETWLVIAIVVMELAALALVVYGLFGMLSEDDDEQSDLP
jgi:hypothetical protein